jgi:hypothetical protein
MAAKNAAPTLKQIQDALVAHGFEVKPAPGIADGLWVAKYGCAAVLARGTGLSAAPGVDPGSDTVVAFRERPGALIQGQIARLLDRGYQKFLMTGKYELPATAQQLQAIHKFTEELTQATGGISLYNEALGTTSDLYEYDRVKGREPLETPPATPWDEAGGAAH